MSLKSEIKKNRRRKRHKQRSINVKLKKKLFGHLAFSHCHYCKDVFLVDDLTIEHIVPLCLDGTNDPSNITLACAPCNQQRGREVWLQKQRSPEYCELARKITQKHYE